MKTNKLELEIINIDEIDSHAVNYYAFKDLDIVDIDNQYKEAYGIDLKKRQLAEISKKLSQLSKNQRLFISNSI